MFPGFSCPCVFFRIDFLHPISHRFQDIADYWSGFRCPQGAPLNALVRGEPLDVAIWPQDTGGVVLSYGVKADVDILNGLRVTASVNGVCYSILLSILLTCKSACSSVFS